MSPETRNGWLVVLGAGLVAILGASPVALSWNDGSRLATVESLAERGTWIIDDSPFVHGGSHYPANDSLLQAFGTQDKLWIAGRYYSDKSPVPALPLAGVAVFLRACGMPAVADSPGWFCWTMCLAAVGGAYVLAVWCIWRLGVPLGLNLSTRVLLTVSFALATVAWTYSRSINNHLLLLSVAAAVWLQLAWLASGERSVWRIALLGGLAGLSYTIDLGAGPPLAALTFLLVCYRAGSWRAVAIFVVCALPCVLLHHGITYALAGTWKPANAVPEYLAWPGSPFHRGNMSGVWGHAGPGAFGLYALDLLFGKKGFLLHNLPLALLLATVPLFRGGLRERAELFVAAAMGGAIWLVYAAGSTNYSGACVTVRWFVPLLAPGFFLLAVTLRERPDLLRDLAILTVGGVCLALPAAWLGPWWPRLLPGYWFIVAATLVVWGVDRAWRVSTPTSAAEPVVSAVR